jgi:hypothetical protein
MEVLVMLFLCLPLTSRLLGRNIPVIAPILETFRVPLVLISKEKYAVSDSNGRHP